MAYDVGEAFIRITPNLAGVVDAISADARRWGDQAASVFSQAWVGGVKRGTSGANVGPSSADSAKQGQSAGGAFADAFKKRVEAALAALPDAKIGADTSDADRKLAEIRAQLEELSGKNIGVDLSDADALAKLEALRVELDELGARSPKVSVQVDVGKASAELAAFQAEVDAAGSSGGGGGGLSTFLSGLPGEFQQAQEGASGLAVGLLSVGSALVPLAAVAGAALGGVASVLATVTAAAGVAVLALGPVIKAVQAVDAANQTTGADAGRTAAQQVSAANAVKSAQASLAEAEANAADARRRSAEQVANAQRSLATAVDQAANNQITAQERLASAEQAVADAQQQQANDRIDQAERLQAAQQALASAEEQAAQSVQQADQQVASAERQLADAQYNEQQAQENLTKARQDAARQLEDYQTQLADGALQQQQAALDVASAQDQLNQTLANPKATDLQRQQAELSYQEALQRQKDLQVQYQRMQEDASAAAQAGVDGSDRVQQALHGQQQAAQGVADAESALGQAQFGAIQAQQDGIAKVAAAQQSLGDTERSIAQQQASDSQRVQQAQQSLADTERANAQQRQADTERIASAQQSLADAVKAQATQERQSAFAVASAQQQVANALNSQATAGGAAASASEKAAAALAKLSPAGQAFATFITGTLGPALQRLEQAAETGFLPGLQAAISAALPLLPPLTGFITVLGGAMGRLAQAAATALGGPFWTQFFQWVASQAGPILQTFGGILGNLAQGFSGMVESLQPVTTLIGQGLLHLSQGFADWANPNGQANGFIGFVGYVIRALPTVVSTVESVVRAIGHILVAAAPIGLAVLPIFKGFADLIEAIPTPVLSVVIGLVAAFAATLLPIPVLIGALASAAMLLFENWSTVWGAIKQVALDAWNDVLKPVFQDYLKPAIDGLGTAVNWLWQNVIEPAWSGIGTAISTAWTSVIKPVFDAVGTAISDAKSGLGAVITWLWHSVIEPAFSGIGTAISFAWTNVIKPVFDAVGTAISDAKSGLGAVITWLWHSVIEPAWTGISSAISFAWTNVMKPALDALGSAFSGLGSGASTLWDTIAGAFKTGVNLVIGVLNFFIEKIDDVLGFFHLSKIPTIPKWTDQASVSGPVGQAPTPGRSPVAFAGGGLIPGVGSDDTVPAWLTPGEFVIRKQAASALGLPMLERLNAVQHFSFGGTVLDVLGDIGTGLGTAAGAVGGVVKKGARELALGILDAAEIPLHALIDAVPSGMFRDWANAIVDQVDTGIRSLINGTADASSSGVASAAGVAAAGAAGGAQRWAPQVLQALGMLGQPANLLPDVLGRMNRESGGDPSIVNTWDSNWAAGHPSVGLMQVIDSTFRTWAGSFVGVGPFKYGVSTDPLANIFAGLNYAIHRYPSLQYAMDKPGGYDDGGFLPPGLSMVFNGTQKPEPILSQSQWAAIRGGGGNAELQAELQRIRRLLETNPAETGEHVAAGVSGEFRKAAREHAKETTMVIRNGIDRRGARI